MKKYIPHLIIVILIILLFKDCGDSEPVQPIPKKGTITITKIKHDTIIRTKYKNTVIIKENDSLLADFIATKDSLEQIRKYKKAIQLNEFNEPYEDDNIKGTISGVVQGELKSLILNYETKPEAVKDTRKNRFLAGIETNVNDLSTKVSLDFQNKKGNIISVSVDDKKTFWIGGKIKIFER